LGYRCLDGHQTDWKNRIFWEFAKKEGGGKLLEIGARKVRWNADELDTTLKTVKNHRLT
jgi:hypothetical protein